MAAWESVLVGVVVVLVLLWWRPGMKRAIQESRNAPKDWGAVLLPIGLVVLFVLFLISMV